MNVWVFQDQPGENLVNELAATGVGGEMVWNVERYVRPETQPHVEADDIVLCWRPKGEGDVAGIYGIGRVSRAPFYSPNVKSNYQTHVKVTHVFKEPVTKEVILANGDPVLRDLQVFQMAGGHIVFCVSETQWHALQELIAPMNAD
jgi:hypothetical protein